jgi:hypothetical protein
LSALVTHSKNMRHEAKAIPQPETPRRESAFNIAPTGAVRTQRYA